MPQPISTARLAAAQFAVNDDVAANLAACVRMIDTAARHRPDVIVLPEFCNHFAWYRDREHAYAVAVDLDGGFLGAIAERARRHACHIMVNVTLRRGDGRITGTNVLFDARGKRVAASDKHTLMGNENNFLERATELCPIVDTPFARLGMYSCMDGVISETTRGLALRGAQVLLNSLNSFAQDEARLHIPVRAAENKVWVVSACKVGDLVPPELVGVVAAKLKIAPEHVQGAGESQIVAPDGSIVARAPKHGEAVICADIEPAAADDKKRPDGTDVFASRRPSLYRAIGEAPAPRDGRPGAQRARVAVCQPRGEGMDAMDDGVEAVRRAARDGAQLVALPELFHVAGGVVTDTVRAARQSEQAVERVQAALKGTAALAATSIVEGDASQGRHVGVLISAYGVALRQPQLHACGRHAWVDVLGDGLRYFDAPWGRLAVVLGPDSIYPEVFRLAAIAGAEVVAVPAHVLEPWEMQYGLPERAAENRLNVLVATRPTQAGESAIFSASYDFTLWAEWTRPFDGNISTPITTRAAREPGLTTADVFPAACANRMVSHKTDLVDGRPWWLAGPITGAT